jgi:hypothetical protein
VAEGMTNNITAAAYLILSESRKERNYIRMEELGNLRIKRAW